MMRSAFILLLCFAELICFAQTDNLILKGIASFENGNYTEASQDFTIFIGNNPETGKGYYYRGMVYMAREKFPEAEADLKRAIELNNSDALLQMAILQARQGNTALSIKHLLQFINNKPEINTIELFKNTEFAPIKSTNEWFNFVSNFTHAEKWEVISEVQFLIKKSDFNEAHHLIDNVIEKKPDDADLYISKSEIYKSANNNTLAIYELNKAIKIRPDDYDILIKLGDLCSAEKKYNEAIQNYISAQTLYPENFNLSLKLAGVYESDGYPEKALKEITYYLSYFPDNIQANIKLAGIYYSLQYYNKALTVLNKFEKSESENPDWLLLRGKTFYQNKTYKSAAYDLSMYLDIDPNSADANYFLGLAQNKLGNQKLACYYMNRAFNAGENKAFKFLQDSCE